jgi:hypothetical protein
LRGCGACGRQGSKKSRKQREDTRPRWERAAEQADAVDAVIRDGLSGGDGDVAAAAAVQEQQEDPKVLFDRLTECAGCLLDLGFEDVYTDTREKLASQITHQRDGYDSWAQQELRLAQAWS